MLKKVQMFNVFKCSRSSKFERTGYFRVLDGFLRINGLRLCEEADFRAQNFQPTLNLNGRTKLQISTSLRLTQNPRWQ
jgi:hypothetical protein